MSMDKISFNKQWEAYAFLAPWIIGFVGLTLLPLVISLFYSFTQYDMLTPPVWRGFSNYLELAEDRRFNASLVTTFKYVFISIPFRLSFALMLAVILRKNLGSMRIYRAAFYLPSLLGGSIAISILWRQLFNKQGLLNQMLLLFGIQGKNWIASPDTAIYTLIILSIWQFGASMVIFLGGLNQISPTYYEAADIDGAGKVRSFFRITLPLLSPIIFFNLVMSMISSFQAFTPAYIISNGSGSPLDTTLLYALYLYIKSFGHFSMGYASAMAWVLVLIIGTSTAILFKLSGRWVYYNE